MASTAPALAAALVAIAVIGGSAIYLAASDAPGIAQPTPTMPQPRPVEPASAGEPAMPSVQPTDPVEPTPPPADPATPAKEPTTRDPAAVSRPATMGASDNGAGLVRLSFDEYVEFLSTYEQPRFGHYYIHDDFMFRNFEGAEMMADVDSGFSATSAPSPRATAIAAPKYSTTNVQVVGVDEPDFVKSDGRHIYALRHNTLAIVDTQVTNPARAVTTVELDLPPLVQKYDMLINGDRLVILYFLSVFNQAGGIDDYTTHALVLDVSDKGSPEPVREFTIPGRLETGRMIGDHAYVVASKMPNYDDPAVPALLLDGRTAQKTPVYMPADEDGIADYPPHLVTVMAFDIGSDEANSVAFVMDPKSTTFMSHTSLYLTASPHGTDEWAAFYIVSQLLGSIIDLLNEPDRDDLALRLDAVEEGDEEAVVSLLGDILESYARGGAAARAGIDVAATQELSKIATDLGLASEATEIYRIGVDGVEFDLAARGTVPGRMLNQFSMDERAGELRVATTVNGRLNTFNNVFVLNSALEPTGALTGIAPDESIYSARFVGDRLYLVTFRQIDPFFVIDLSGDDPEILGELKMPGYSDYLHFYDESTVIGIGREDGLKIAMFDISDIRRPSLADSIVLGSWGTWSQAEHEHKALLVSREHAIMSIPVISGNNLRLPIEQTLSATENEAGTFTFLVYGIGQSGFDLMQSLGHDYTYDTDTDFARSLYIGQSLYTVSDSAITRSPVDGDDYVTKIPLALQ